MSLLSKNHQQDGPWVINFVVYIILLVRSYITYFCSLVYFNGLSLEIEGRDLYLYAFAKYPYD